MKHTLKGEYDSRRVWLDGKELTPERSQVNGIMITSDIEVAVARRFGWHKYIIVPNVSYGAHFQHELDLLLITKSGYGIEIEIKTSKTDLRKDKLKQNPHGGNHIKCVYFAVPKEFGDISKYIQNDYGIIHVSEGSYTEIFRHPVCNKCEPYTIEERLNICRLGCMRIWNLKSKIKELDDYIDQHKDTINKSVEEKLKKEGAVL